MSHAPSAFGAALVVWLWDRHRERRTPARLPAPRPRARPRHVPALAERACSRSLPGVRPPAARAPAGVRRRASCAASRSPAASSPGAFPQMAAWNGLYGEWVLPHPPHGADFLRLDRPFVLETLFSSRHGLLSWTPVLWLGFLGLWPAPALAARARAAAAAARGAHDLREHVLGRLVGGRLVLEPPLRQPAARSSPSGIAASLEMAGGLRSRDGRPSVPAALAVAAASGTSRSRKGVRDRGARGAGRLRRGRRGPARRRDRRRASAALPPGRRAGSSPGATAGRPDSTIRWWAATSSTARTTCRAASTSARRATTRCSARDGARARSARA